jgi:hypothetical protein
MGEKRKLMKDIDAAEFMTWVQVKYQSLSGADAHAASRVRQLDHFSDPLVTVIVGEEQFKLPKALNSTFLDKPFNDGFKGGLEQMVTLDTRMETFQLIAQGMHTSQVVILTFFGGHTDSTKITSLV